MAEKIEIRSLIATLKGGAQISVGFATQHDDDDSYWFEFIGVEGHITRLRLSEEAFETIIGLKPKVDIARNVKTEMRWQLVGMDQMPINEPSEPTSTSAE